jgi:hypothetical protein
VLALPVMATVALATLPGSWSGIGILCGLASPMCL